MYQGEVDVAEEDLPAFLEVAEDLNIRGLSERNMERSHQNEDTSFKPSDLSSKKEMETENEENASIGSFTRDAEDSENYISDNSKSSPFSPRKAKTRKITQRYCENTNQTIISTFGGKGYSCEKCEKQFSDLSGLYYHKRNVHENIQ